MKTRGINKEGLNERDLSSLGQLERSHGDRDLSQIEASPAVLSDPQFISRQLPAPCDTFKFWGAHGVSIVPAS